MNVVPPLPFPPADALERARRLAGILAGLAAVVARRFLRDPKLLVLILPLWGWLGRTARRFERAVTRVRPASVRTTPRVVSATVTRVRAPRVRFPGGRGWLVRVLGYEAAAYRSQLEYLLAEPETQILRAAVPSAARLLRPLCRMLGTAEPARPVEVNGPPRAPKVKVRRIRVRKANPFWRPGRSRPILTTKMRG